MTHQTNVSSLPQDDNVIRCVLVIQRMKIITRNIIANCIPTGKFHKVFTVMVDAYGELVEACPIKR
jgi:hypothetical protein